MAEQIPLTPESIADLPHPDDGTNEIADDLAYRRLAMVNVVFFGAPHSGSGQWVLIDAGVPGMSHRVLSAVSERFGEDARPAAILLTHGHFDHVGSLQALAEKWNVPIFAHADEMPYLNGTAVYPPVDPTVGGGIMPLIMPLFPRRVTDVSRWLKVLPVDGSVPEMPGWRWLHTPGHSVGHVSFWREADRTLVAGDAFITTDMESAYAIVTQAEQIHGPPTFLTPDWVAARESVQKLAALEPELVVCGHGRAMRGPAMREALRQLAANFDEIAVPKTSRYAREPANKATGKAYEKP